MTPNGVKAGGTTPVCIVPMKGRNCPTPSNIERPAKLE